MNTSRLSGRLNLLGVAALLLPLTAVGLFAQDGAPIRLPQASSAWEQSIAREAQGDIAGARQLMLGAYGARPSTYDPCVRLAWLNYLLKDGAEAVTLYRRARELPGALSEATVGLGLALTMRGYAELARGAFGDARVSWIEALALNATNADARHGIDLIGGASGVTPEFWAATIAATKGSSQAQVFYAQLPVRLDTHIGARVGFRQVASPTPTDSTAVFAAQTEFYGGITRDIGRMSVELLGFIITGSSSSSVASLGPPLGRTSTSTRRASGTALNVRAGGTYGVTATAAMIAHGSSTNTQIVPMAFLYVTPSVALSAGARFTTDSAFSAVSPMAAVSLRRGGLLADVAAHVGKERWAFSPAGPTILSFLDETTSGVTGTVGWSPVRAVSVFAQAQIEQTKSSGSFRSVGVGVQLHP